MTPAYLNIGKIAYWVVTVVAVAFIALDPKVQVEWIGAATVVVTQIVALVITIMNRKDITKMSINVDGNFKRLLDEKDKLQIDKDQEVTNHAATAEKLSHAQGRREGIAEGASTSQDKHKHRKQ